MMYEVVSGVARPLLAATSTLQSTPFADTPLVEVRGLRCNSHFFDMSFSSRRLPHVQPEGKWLFVTWHLHGSLRHGVYPPAKKASSGKAFVWMDQYLDRALSGPRYLAQPSIARIVLDSLYKGVELGHYNLGAFVVMANHVHVLLLPRISASRLLQSLKGFTAREANRALRRSGEPFWQAESYDHWVRSDQEYFRIVRYIENNPVKAGLVTAPEQYQWSSAYPKERVEMSLDPAGLGACATKSGH